MSRPYLPSYMTTLTNRRQARVGEILDSARVAREEVNTLADRLEATFSELSPMALSEEAFNSLITSGTTGLNFRDVDVRIFDLFTMANTVSTILDSHKASFSAEIKALEDELIALEKMAANYAFLLGDGKAYDYAFLEPFNNDTGRDISLTFDIPDRGGQSFAAHQNAVILSDQGVLTLPTMTGSHGLVGTIMTGNATAYMTNDTDFSNVYTASASTGWTATIRTPSPVTAAMPGAGGRAGVQVPLEFTLSQPAPASQIKISPLADFSVELLQVSLYTGDSEDTRDDLMAEGEFKTLNRSYTLQFPMRTVSRFKLLICQPAYDYLPVQVNETEAESRRMLEEAKARRSMDRASAPTVDNLRTAQDRHRKHRLTALCRKIRIGSVNLEDRQYQTSVPASDSSWGILSTGHFLKSLRHRPGDSDQWNPEDAISTAFLRMATQRIPELRELSNNTDESQSYNPDFRINETLIALHSQARLNAYQYRYRLGLSNVAIGAEAPGFKGVYISKPLNAPGDVGEVRLKAAYTDAFNTTTARNSTQVTSVEFSVTSQSNPKFETQWVPILPTGETLVTGERFFPDNGGKGYFRFSAKMSSNIRVYRNGFSIAIDPRSYLLDLAGEVAGLTLAVGQYNLDDVFTVDYQPVGDPTTISFAKAGFNTDAPLVTNYDDQGAGESYATTLGRNEIDLLHTPYIDPVRAQGSPYVPNFGHANFSPIVVSLLSGAIITNLTNYLGGEQTTLPTAAQGYYYVHAGRTLLFNQKVENFRVYYQYLENALRFRVALRVNDKNFASPEVDFAHLKGKTRRPNPLAAQI